MGLTNLSQGAVFAPRGQICQSPFCGPLLDLIVLRLGSSCTALFVMTGKIEENRGQTELSTRRKPSALGQFRLSPAWRPAQTNMGTDSQSAFFRRRRRRARSRRMAFQIR